MELILERLYFPNGTNGRLLNQNELICYTIELPWLQNQRQISCIPEGRYNLVKRCSKRFGIHFLIENVKNRSLILIHPANNAKKELLGCIAPVTTLTGQGTGLFTRKALNKLKEALLPILDNKKKIQLTIKTATNEF